MSEKREPSKGASVSAFAFSLGEQDLGPIVSEISTYKKSPRT